MDRKPITMGEAKQRWMQDMADHPGNHSADERMLYREYCWNKEPNPHFDTGVAMALLRPHIEAWVAAKGFSVVHI